MAFFRIPQMRAVYLALSRSPLPTFQQLRIFVPSSFFERTPGVHDIDDVPSSPSIVSASGKQKVALLPRPSSSPASPDETELPFLPLAQKIKTHPSSCPPNFLV